MRLTGGQVFDAGRGFSVRDLCVNGGRIVEDAAGATDVSGCWVLPGLTDLHFHGCVGEDFSDGTPEGLQKMADYELSRGVTQICPAGMTLSEELLTRVCENAAAHAAGKSGGAELVGINLEGPFLSMAKRGAQNAAYLHEPDIGMLRRLNTASGGLVKLVTLAPEEPGSMEFVRQAVSERVTVSVGHTTADYDTASSAFANGAAECTHLYNAMPPFTHRAPGVIGAAFDRPHVKVELICDGVHIHPSVVRATFRLFGADRVILISDTMRAAGMPDGDYTLGGQPVRVKGNRAVLADEPDTIAGSVTDLMACLKTAVSFGVPLADAVTAAAVNPARVLGVYDRVGSLDVGKDANIAILDQRLDLKAVIFRGEIVSGSL